jgi:hypothetical protein
VNLDAALLWLGQQCSGYFPITLSARVATSAIVAQAEVDNRWA